MTEATSKYIISASALYGFRPRENDFPVREDHYTPASSSSLGFHSSCDVTPSIPSTSTPEQHSTPRSMSRTEANRRHRRAAASHPYHARGYDRERAPASTEHRCCHNQEYRPQSIMSRRARLRRATATPNLPSWQHLPVTIEPEKWYQVVGSMQCEYCKAMGRHQQTSWICQLCQVPLCLMPFRNCYSVWHGQKC